MPSPLASPLCRALILAAGLLGCAEAPLTYTPLNPAPRQLHARMPDDVELLSSGPPKRPHVDVAVISTEEREDRQAPDQLIGLLRRLAAEKGCDALMLAPPASKSHEATGGGTNGHQVYSGTCVVYQ